MRLLKNLYFSGNLLSYGCYNDVNIINVNMRSYIRTCSSFMRCMFHPTLFFCFLSSLSLFSYFLLSPLFPFLFVLISFILLYFLLILFSSQTRLIFCISYHHFFFSFVLYLSVFLLLLFLFLIVF